MSSSASQHQAWLARDCLHPRPGKGTRGGVRTGEQIVAGARRRPHLHGLALPWVCGLRNVDFSLPACSRA